MGRSVRTEDLGDGGEIGITVVVDLRPFERKREVFVTPEADSVEGVRRSREETAISEARRRSGRQFRLSNVPGSSGVVDREE